MLQSVTGRVKSVKQPYGGYLPKKMFKHVQIDDGTTLNPQENISGSKMGMTVDYLSRLMLGASPEDAFSISLSGAKILDKLTGNGATQQAYDILKSIKGLDDQSIINATQLTAYDVCLRVSPLAFNSESVEQIPDKATIENIVTIVKRTMNFWQEHGPIVRDGFTFEGGGYTPTISSGDGDYLTSHTLWDLKVARKSFDKNYSLQILVYYLTGKHSNQSIYDGINQIGLFNPRLNEYYILNVADIPVDIIQTVETEVIGYPKIEDILKDAMPISEKTNLFYIENNLLEVNHDYTSYKTLDDNVEKSFKEHSRRYWKELGVKKNKDFEILEYLNQEYHKQRIISIFKEENADTIYNDIPDKDYDVGYADVDGTDKEVIAIKINSLKKAIKEGVDLSNSDVQDFLKFLEDDPEPVYVIDVDDE